MGPIILSSLEGHPAPRGDGMDGVLERAAVLGPSSPCRGGLSQQSCAELWGFLRGSVWTEFPLDGGLDRVHPSLCSLGASASPLGRGNSLPVYFGDEDLSFE